MILGEKFDDAIQKLNELEESLTVRDFFTTASTYLLTSEHIGTVTIVFWLLMKWTCIILELR